MTDKPKRKIVIKADKPSAKQPEEETKINGVPNSFEDLLKEVDKTSEKSADVSTFKKFINEEEDRDEDDDEDDEDDEDDDDDDDEDCDGGVIEYNKRSDDDLKNIRLIRNYRREFPSLNAPDEDKLNCMGSRQLANEVERCRSEVSGGIGVEEVSSIYFTACSCVEQAAPAWGLQLYGSTEKLKESQTVATCLRAATCELQAQITTSVPWYLMLPFSTSMVMAKTHFQNKAESATMNILNRPVKRDVETNKIN